MIKRIFKRIGLANIVIVLMQLSMYPYLFYFFWGLPGTDVMAIAFFVIISFLCFAKYKKHSRIHSSLVWIMLIQTIVWLLYFIFFNDTSYLVRVFFIVLTYLSLLLLSKAGSIEKFSYVYNYIIAIQGVLGAIAFILIFFSLIQPISTMSFNDYGDLLEFYGLTFVKVHIGNFVRINGFFDEPGAFSFWGMFALLFNKLTFDNRKIEIVIIISLVFTFSSAYFILLPIYFLWFYGNHLKTFLLLIVFLAPLVFFAAKFLSTNEGFLRYTVERFEGGKVESTRYDQADFSKKIFVSSPLIGIGARNMEEKYGTISSDNPYEILAKDGILGCLITYLPLLFIAFKYIKRREVLGAVIILSLNYLQRPFHMNIMHYFMLFFFCLLVIQKYNRRTLIA